MTAAPLSPTSLSQRLLQLLAIGLLPFLTMAGLELFSQARGAYFLQYNQDPDYCYLLNGLVLLEGHTPGHTDHPGTPLQYLVAGVLRASHPELPPEALSDAVLRDPERYLRRCSLVLKTLVVLSLLAAGLTTLRCSGSVAVAVLAQSSPLLFPEILLSATRVYPEALSISLCNLALCGLVALLYRPTKEASAPAALFVFLGVVTAVLVDNKMLAAPLFVTGLLLAWRSRRAIAYVASFAVTLALLLLLIRERWPILFKWVSANATHSDRYGHGAPGFLVLHSFLQNLGRVLQEQIILSVTLGVAIGIWVVALLPPLRRRLQPELPVLGALLACFLLTLLVICKNPVQHYLIVPFALTPVLLIAIHRQLPSLLGLHRWPVYASVGVLALLSLPLSLPALGHSATQLAETSACAEKAFSAARQAAPEAQPIATYRTSTPEYALAFGNMFASYRFTSRLQQLYPRAADYITWANVLSRFDYCSQRDTIPPAPSYRLQGTWLTDVAAGKIAARLFPSYQIREIARFGEERMLLVSPSAPAP